MSLAAHDDSSAGGYETVLLPLRRRSVPGAGTANAAILRRRSVRPSKRAVLYVHCLGDSPAPPELAAWYLDRGFDFYVADLRGVGGAGQPGGPRGDGAAAEELAGCFTLLDAAVAHQRNADAIGSVLLSAHGAGALIAALWSHARRGSGPVNALVLASPEFSSGGRRPARPGACDQGQPRVRPLLAGAQRRLRRGLDIACPVLVMCPADGWDTPSGPGGLLGFRRLLRGRATTHLGAHVTWMKLEGAQRGEALPGPEGHRRFFDELGRWLGAYLSGQIRDQLL